MSNNLSASRLADEQSSAYARALYQAHRTRTPIAPLTESDESLGVAEAYAIQQHLVDLLLADGEEIVGFKLGLTSVAMQHLLGVDQPDFGPLFASGVFFSPASVSAGRFIAPRIEAEIAVVLGSDLAGPNCTILDVREATAGLVATVEVVDSRIIDWRIKIADTVADLASGGALVRSEEVVPLTDWDPRLTGMVFRHNGEVAATSAGAAALGDPLAAVAWLANTLSSAGVTLRAGQLIMTGALHAMVPVKPGDHVVAEFDRLGLVETTITE